MFKKYCKKHNRRTYRFFTVLFAISLLGFVLRLIFCFELQHNPEVCNPSDITDMETYQRLAHNILDGEGPERFYYQPFYYTIFLPAVYFLAGGANFAVSLLQVVIGTTTIWLTGVTGSRLFGRPAGLIAAFVLALAKAPIFFTPFLLIATLQTFWMILLAYIGISAWKTNSLYWWAGTAIVLCLSALTRGNVILLLPVVIILAIWRNRNNYLKFLAAVGIILAITFLPRLPFALKNYEHYGYWTGASSAAGSVLAPGNTPEAPPGGLSYTDAYDAWTTSAQRSSSKERVSVTSRLWEWICQEPLAYAELKWQAFLLFWNQQEIPNNVSYADEGKESVMFQQPFLLGFGVIGVFGFAGLLLGCTRIPRSPCVAYFYSLFIVYMGSVILFYILTRFRVPIDPYLAVATGHFIAVAGRKVKRHRRGKHQIQPRTVTLIGAVAGGIVLVWGGFPVYNHLWESYVMKIARPHGVFVKTDNRKKLYDHGPRRFGGWQTFPVNQGVLYIQKSFSLPPQVRATDTIKKASLRLPIQAVGPTRVKVTVRDQWGNSLAQKDAYIKTSELRWISIPLEQVPVKNDKKLFFKIRINTKTGTAATVLDLQRDYGRTKIRQKPNEPWQPGVGEVAVELVWERSVNPST